jgi:hypothetical protein
MDCCRSPYDVVFGQYLDMVANESVCMHFYQAILLYKEDLHIVGASGCCCHEMERIAQCTLIFEKYLSKRSSAMRTLPRAIHTDIVKNMLRPDVAIFDKAEAWVLSYLCEHRWGPFKSEIMERADHLLLNTDPGVVLPVSPDAAEVCVSEPSAPAGSVAAGVTIANKAATYENFTLKLARLVSKPAISGKQTECGSRKEQKEDGCDGERGLSHEAEGGVCVTDAEDVVLTEEFAATPAEGSCLPSAEDSCLPSAEGSCLPSASAGVNGLGSRVEAVNDKKLSITAADVIRCVAIAAASSGPLALLNKLLTLLNKLLTLLNNLLMIFCILYLFVDVIRFEDVMDHSKCCSLFKVSEHSLILSILVPSPYISCCHMPLRPFSMCSAIA